MLQGIYDRHVKSTLGPERPQRVDGSQPLAAQRKVLPAPETAQRIEVVQPGNEVWRRLAGYLVGKREDTNLIQPHGPQPIDSFLDARQSHRGAGRVQNGVRIGAQRDADCQRRRPACGFHHTTQQMLMPAMHPVEYPDRHEGA
jgi:hypothetical protein